MRFRPIERLNLLSAKGAEPMDTLLYEIAHVADRLLGSNHGHGDMRREWARHAGCRRETKGDRPVVRSRTERLTTLPPLPLALRRCAA